MKYRALVMGVFCFLGMSLEACMPCFSWRKKNQVVPVGISEERKKKIKELVAAAPEGHFIILHARSNTQELIGYKFYLEDISYLRECLKERYEQNPEFHDKIIAETGDRFRKVMLSGNAHKVHQQMKHKGKLGSQDIRDIKQEAAQVLIKINNDNLYNTTQSIAPKK